MKVIDDEICFKASEVYNVYRLFDMRANMHHVVYTHKKAKAVEYMIVDAVWLKLILDGTVEFRTPFETRKSLLNWTIRSRNKSSSQANQSYKKRAT